MSAEAAAMVDTEDVLCKEFGEAARVGPVEHCDHSRGKVSCQILLDVFGHGRTLGQPTIPERRLEDAIGVRVKQTYVTVRAGRGTVAS